MSAFSRQVRRASRTELTKRARKSAFQVLTGVKYGHPGKAAMIVRWREHPAYPPATALRR